MRWFVVIAVLVIAGTTAAGIYEPQIKRFFGACPHGEAVFHGRSYPITSPDGHYYVRATGNNGIFYSEAGRAPC